MVFQHFNLVHRSKVITNVLAGRLGYTNPALSLVNRFSKADVEKAHRQLERVGLQTMADRRSDALSGGQQQRVGVARALMQDPEILLADEPVASLDPVLAHSIMRYLELINDDGVMVLCSLHHLDLVHRYADKVIALNEGILMFEGPPSAIDDDKFKEIYGRRRSALVDLETRPPDTTLPPGTKEEPRPRRWRRALALILAIVAAVWVYAFAFDRVDVSLDEIQSETRQAQLFRILRALAQPDLVTFERDIVTLSIDVQVPCAPGGDSPSAGGGGPSIAMVPPCADPGSIVTIEGTGFEAGGTGILAFVPDSDFDISLNLARFNAGDDGTFALEVELPDRPSEQPQQIEAETSARVGSLLNFFNPFDAPQTVTADNGEVLATPRWSENALLTWERIIETVMLALLATTVGTALAIPFSFLAARNLMRDISTPVVNLALTLIAIPIGIWVGVLGSRTARALSEPLVTSLWVEALMLIVLPVVIRYLFRWAVPVGEIDPPSPGTRAARGLVLFATAVLAILFLIELSQFMLGAGQGIQDNTGALGFLGNFIDKLR